MKQFRQVMLFLVLLVGLLIVPSALAQDTFGLSNADYAYWTNAVETSAAFNTLSYDYTFRFNVSGVDSGDINIQVAGGGQIGEMNGVPMFSMTAVGEMTIGRDRTPIDMEVRTVGDLTYLELVKGSGWTGGTAEDFLSGFTEALGLSELPIDPESLFEGDMGDMMAVPGMTDAIMALSMLQASDFIAISRKADMGGQAHFVIDLKIADLLSSDALSPLLGLGLAQGMGADASGMTDQEMRQMSMLIGMLFSDLTLTYEQFINTSTNLVERGVLTLNFPLPAMLTGGADTLIEMEMVVNLSGYNEPISVEAPKDFQRVR